MKAQPYADLPNRRRRPRRWAESCARVLVLASACAHPSGGAVQAKDIPDARQVQAPPDSFRSIMDAAMARMHQGMSIPYTGDPDRDFAAMMIPHHQGAIDMAVLELRFGRDERLRRLAQEIIVEQQAEIVVMRMILDGLPPPPAGQKER